jgi:HEAT repeat protein
MKQAVEALAKATADPDAWVRAHATCALKFAPPAARREVRTTLRRALTDSDPQVRLYAATALLPLSSQADFASALALLEDPRPRLQFAALLLLETIKVREADAVRKLVHAVLSMEGSSRATDPARQVRTLERALGGAQQAKAAVARAAASVESLRARARVLTEAWGR